MLGLSIELIVELVVAVMLGVTVFYCIALERRLRALRSGQDGLKATIDQLNTATARAEMSIAQLKQASGELDAELAGHTQRAEAVVRDLKSMVSTGNVMAEQLRGKGNALRRSQAQEAAPVAPRTRSAPARVAERQADVPAKPVSGEKLLDSLRKAR